MMDNDIRDVLMALAEAVATSEIDKAQIKFMMRYNELAEVTLRIAEKYGVEKNHTATLEEVNQATAYFTAVVETLKEFEEKMK